MNIRQTIMRFQTSKNWSVDISDTISMWTVRLSFFCLNRQKFNYWTAKSTLQNGLSVDAGNRKVYATAC